MDVHSIAEEIIDVVMSGSIFTQSGKDNIQIGIERILSRELDGSLFPSEGKQPNP